MSTSELAADEPAAPPRPSAFEQFRRLVPGLIVVTIATVVATAVSNVAEALSALVCAVVLGAILGNLDLISPAMAPGVEFAAKRLLRVGVVLLGLRLSFADVRDLGAETILIVVATVTATFFATQWLGRRLGLSPALSLLIATGYSICGASAIAAVESSTDAESEEVAAAIGLVTLFGSLAIVVLPLFAGWFGLDDVAYGTWVGASVHDVAQVVATASSGGAAVLAIAIVVKLTRVLLLAPIVTGVAVHRRMKVADDVDGASRPPILPLFVFGFLVMVAVRTAGILPTSTIDHAKTLEGWLLAAALVGLGSGVRFSRLRRLGPRPLVVGAIAWVLVAGVSLLGIQLTG